MTFLRTSKRYKITGYFSCYLIPFGGRIRADVFTIGHRVRWIDKPAGNIRGKETTWQHLF